MVVLKMSNNPYIHVFDGLSLDDDFNCVHDALSKPINYVRNKITGI